MLGCLLDYLLAYDGAEDEVSAEDAKLDPGVLQNCEIGFENIKMVLKGKKSGDEDRLILDGSIRGKASPGRMVRYDFAFTQNTKPISKFILFVDHASVSK